jgi:citrate lyase gamma subunit
MSVKLNSFTRLRALLVLDDRGILAHLTLVTGHYGLQVWSFVHAHTHACEVLTKQVDNIDKHALDKVVAESKAQVALAKAYLVDLRVAFPELVRVA